MLEYLIELAKTETPITLGSLENSFDDLDCSTSSYYDTRSFIKGICGGWFYGEKDSEGMRVYVVPYNFETYRNQPSKETDEVIIVKLSSKYGKEVYYLNDKYCRKVR